MIFIKKPGLQTGFDIFLPKDLFSGFFFGFVFHFLIWNNCNVYPSIFRPSFNGTIIGNWSIGTKPLGGNSTGAQRLLSNKIICYSLCPVFRQSHIEVSRSGAVGMSYNKNVSIREFLKNVC